MIDIRSIKGFIIGDLIPGVVLSFDFYMIIDNWTSGCLKGLNLDTLMILLIFLVSSIIFGITLSAIVFPITELIVGIIFNDIFKMNKKRGQGELTENLWTLRGMFSCMVIPTVIFGSVFPTFVSCPALQPGFPYICYFMAFVFFCLALLQEVHVRKGGGYYL